MTARRTEVDTILTHRRIICLRDHHQLRRTLYHLMDQGHIVALHPGVFVRAADRGDTDIRILAATRWQPDAILTGRAAARMSFWRDLPVPLIELSLPRRQQPRAGLVCRRTTIPEAWVWRYRDASLTAPAMTVVQLLPSMGGAVLPEAFRRGVTYADLLLAVDALPGRRDQVLRRRLIREFRDAPWSIAEQSLHVLMRRGRLRGWIANYPITIDGLRRYLDVVFEEQRLVIEVDGFEFHAGRTENRQRFEDDRSVANWLVVRGWTVLRFTWRQIAEQPEWVLATICAALRRIAMDDRAARRGFRAPRGA